MKTVCLHNCRPEPDFRAGRTVTDHETGSSWLCHYRENLGMLYCLEGAGEMSLEGKSVAIAPGDLVLFRGGPPYRFHSEHAWDILWFHLLPRAEVLEPLRYREELPGLGKLHFEGAEAKRARRELLEAQQLEFLRPPGWNLQAKLLVECVLARAGRCWRQEGAVDPRLFLAQKLLAGEGDGAIGKIARRCGMSHAVFYTRFREEFGCSPRRYREQLRMRQACSLLESSSLTIGEIAARLGMCDRYYFSNRFRKFTGCSPSEYRRRAGC